MYASILHLTCPRGIAGILAGEVRALGYEVEDQAVTSVRVRGTMQDAVRLNLWLRTAHRVLMLINEFKAKDPDALYTQLMRLPWESWIPADGYVSVTVSGKTDAVRDPRFAALKTKDAIVDRIQSEKGRRPDAGPDRSRTVVHLHWDPGKVELYLDTSGEPLSFRGYRQESGQAPMRESLAAACILATGWNGDGCLVNPMCGSGTLAIEAAMIGARIAPGTARNNFGFLHLVEDHRPLLREELSRAAGEKNTPASPQVHASDIDPRMITAARNNARRAGVMDSISFQNAELRSSRVPPGPGVVILNPPYGQRLGDHAGLRDTYRGIGTFLKERCRGKTAFVFTGNPVMARETGLKPSASIPMSNGDIDCRLITYPIH